MCFKKWKHKVYIQLHEYLIYCEHYFVYQKKWVLSLIIPHNAQNIVLHIYNLNWGFNVGEIIDTSLLNSPLLNWDGILNKDISRKELSNIVLLFYYKYLKIIDDMNNTWL